MEPVDTLKNFWQSNAGPEANPSALNNVAMENFIKSRIKKERKILAEFFWASLAFQILIYSFACHLVVRYWGDPLITSFCAAGALLYIPFTIILMRKFKALFQPVSGPIRTSVSNQYGLLNRFFRFKKGFDLAAIPVNSFILSGILFKLYVPGGMEDNWSAFIISILSLVLIFATATWFENKKHFKKPLRQFEMILEDIEKN